MLALKPPRSRRGKRGKKGGPGRPSDTDFSEERRRRADALAETVFGF